MLRKSRVDLGVAISRFNQGSIKIA